MTTVIVSGGSRGLGQAIVTALLADGCRVATFSRHETDFTRAQSAADPDGTHFTWRKLDGTDGEGVRAFVKETAARFDGVDVLINNAAIAADGVLPLLTAKAIHDVVAINLTAAIELAQACTRAMLARARGGVILNISSIVGSRGYSGLSVYSATKAALDGFSRSLARELGPRGIRVNSIAPGYLESEMSAGLDDAQRRQIVNRTPLGRLAEPADVTGVVRFLISPAAAFITGQTLIVDGGITC